MALEFITLGLGVITLAVCFKLHRDIRLLRGEAVVDRETMKTQDLKLYNLIKSNFNVMTGRKTRGEINATKDDVQSNEEKRI